MSRNLAPGMCASRYSSRPLRPLDGMNQLQSTGTRSSSPRCCASQSVETSESITTSVIATTPDLIRGTRQSMDCFATLAMTSGPDGDDPPRKGQYPSRVAGRGAARLCAEPQAGRSLPGAVRGPGVYLAVPGYRPARFRTSGD